MVGHARKRQKTGKQGSGNTQPLGSCVSLTDEASKDDEERRLESLLLGTPFVPVGKDKSSLLVGSDHEDDGEPFGDGKELENLTDADVSLLSQNLSSSEHGYISFSSLTTVHLCQKTQSTLRHTLKY
jgi:hypothetical protein